MSAPDPQALVALSAERPLITPERHPSNDYYGNATQLKRYAGLRPRSALAAAIEHGIVLSDFVWDVDLESGLPLLLCASSARARAIAPALPHGMRAIPIGPLIHYVGRPVPPVPARDDGVLLAFPAHSTHHVPVEYDAEVFADLLATRRRRYADVHVCMYWRDVQRGLHRPYLDRGLTCVTAGHIFDPRFLERLHAIIGRASAVVTNQLGSHVIYSVALGRPVWFFDQELERRADDATLQRDGPAAPDHPWYVALSDAFAEERDHLTPAQREVVAEIGGTPACLDRGRLRALLLEAAREHAARTPTPRRAARDALRLGRYAASRLRSAGRAFLDSAGDGHR